MSTTEPSATVSAEVVRAALRAAEFLGKDVADVSITDIAREAGISRSTLLRHLGGTRQALDAAVRETGIDPGGQAPVRERAALAAAAIIGERGLSAMTFEAVAAEAKCSIHSLYAAYGGRDELLRAVFDRFGPILDLEEAVKDQSADFEETVHRVYQSIAEAFSREPRVIPAMFAEVMARPDSPAARTVAQHIAPRMLSSLGQWLTNEIAAGRIRDLPLPVLIQQMIAPILMHTALRPAGAHVTGLTLPELHQSCTIFAEAFLRGVCIPAEA